MIEFFAPMRLPSTTHNAMEIHKYGGKSHVGKSKALLEAEAKWEAYLTPFAPPRPITGALRAIVKLCWATDGKHTQGEPKVTKPDLDNLEKTIWDVCQRLGYYRGDQQIVDKHVSKMWADPAGIYLKIEQVCEQVGE